MTYISTINPANPAQATPVSSAVMRANFQAAYNDVNALSSILATTTQLSIVAQRMGTVGEYGTGSTASDPFLASFTRHICPGGANSIQLVYAGLELQPSETYIPPGCYQAIGVTYSDGTDYAVGDVDVYNPSATNGFAPIQVQIMQVASGVPTLVQIVDGGLFTTMPSGSQSPSWTTASGTGATATFTWKGGAYGIRASIQQAWGSETFTGQNPCQGVNLGYVAGGYNGQRNINILVPSGGYIITDPIPVNIPVGGAFGLRATIVGNNTPLGRRPIGIFWGSQTAANYEFAIFNPNNTYNPGDIAVSNTSIGTSTTNNTLVPLLILGQPKVTLPTVIAAYADSRCAGGTSGTGAIGSYDPLDNDGNQSWFEKALCNPLTGAISTGLNWPWANFARGSDRASYAIPNLNLPYTNPIIGGRNMRMMGLRLGRPTAVYINLSINDFINSETLSQLLAYEQQLVQEARGVGAQYVFTDTTDPNTSSSDDWATKANQTLEGTSNNQLARNQGLRNGTYNPGYDFFIDNKTVVSDPSDERYWITTGVANATTGDGIHASPAIIILKAQNAVTVMQQYIKLP